MNGNSSNHDQTNQSGNGAQKNDQQRQDDEQFWTEWWREYAQTWK